MLTASLDILASRLIGPVFDTSLAEVEAVETRRRAGASAAGIRDGSHVRKYMSPSKSPDAIVSGTECEAVEGKTMVSEI